MTKSQCAIAIACAIFLLAPTAPAIAGCGPAFVCGEVVDSFMGTVVSEGLTAPAGVELSWSVESEAGVAGYRISRRDCPAAQVCSVPTHLVYSAGSCGQTKEYRVTDSPPGGPVRWTYRIEVWGADGSLACAADVNIE